MDKKVELPGKRDIQYFDTLISITEDIMANWSHSKELKDSSEINTQEKSIFMIIINLRDFFCLFFTVKEVIYSSLSIKFYNMKMDDLKLQWIKDLNISRVTVR